MRTILMILIVTAFVCSCKNPTSVKKETEEKRPEVQTADTISAAIAQAGERVFTTICATCHKNDTKLLAPSPGVLSTMTPRSVLAALRIGKMRVQAEKLTEDERKAVAQWVTQKVLKENSMSEDAYTAFNLSPDENAAFSHSGWGGNAEGTGFRTAAQAGIDSSNVSSLKLKWAFAFAGASQARCKPALINNWLIVGSEFGDVYALHTQTGKIGWHFAADAAIRGAITVINENNNVTAYFADYSTNAYAVDVKSGKLLWKTRAGYHPQSSTTGSVAVFDNRVYVPLTSFEVISTLDPNYDCCSSSGGVVALDAQSGKIVWQYKVIAEEAKQRGKKKNGKYFYGPSGAPVWSSPTIDAKRGVLYIGTGENYTDPPTTTSDAVQAIDLKTGKLIWSFQGHASDTWNLACPGNPNCPDKVGPDFDFGMAPLIAHKKDGSDILLAGEKSGVVYALSPSGKLIWQKRIGKGGALGGIHWGMATDGEYVYAANADNTSDIAGYDTDKAKPSPGIYALDINTGDVKWKAATPSCDTTVKGCRQCNSAAPTVTPDIVFAGALDGHIRAYSVRDGKIVWDYDTVKDFETINKIKGKGGALDGAAPVAANGMLFVNSGYGQFGEIPGNVLLAFEVQKNQ
ncbi:MAG: dehydrogenase [Chitinophagaceae bacterium]|nr:dehydrogenase [Chitinophagaceae bacterium]